jgi:hypothetical protein
MGYMEGPFPSDYAVENKIDRGWIVSEYGEPLGPYEPINFAVDIGGINFVGALEAVSYGAVFGEDKEVYFLSSRVKEGINYTSEVGDEFTWNIAEEILQEEPEEELVEELLEPSTVNEKVRAKFWESTAKASLIGTFATPPAGLLGTTIASLYAGEQAFEAMNNYLGPGALETASSVGAGIAGFSTTAVVGAAATFATFIFSLGQTHDMESKALNLKRDLATRDVLNYMDEEGYEIYAFKSDTAQMDLREIEGFSTETQDQELRGLLAK